MQKNVVRKEFMETEERIYTIKDIEALPEGERAELIDGEMFRMDSPELAHQDILGELAMVVRQYIRNRNGDCKVFFSPFAVYINKDIYNYVEPDLLVICDLDKLDRKGCHGAPDWLVEIVSPGSKKMDYVRKLFKYRTTGVREYWIVDPMKKMIKVYDFDHDTEKDYTFEDKISVGIYDDFVIDFGAFDKSLWD